MVQEKKHYLHKPSLYIGILILVVHIVYSVANIAIRGGYISRFLEHRAATICEKYESSPEYKRVVLSNPSGVNYEAEAARANSTCGSATRQSAKYQNWEYDMEYELRSNQDLPAAEMLVLIIGTVLILIAAGTSHITKSKKSAVIGIIILLSIVYEIVIISIQVSYSGFFIL